MHFAEFFLQISYSSCRRGQFQLWWDHPKPASSETDSSYSSSCSRGGRGLAGLVLELLQTVIMEEEEGEGDRKGEDTAWDEVFSRLNRAHRMSVRINIWILLSDYLQKDGNAVFSRLDKGDGREDGKIKCADFIEWIDTLTFQDSVSLEVENSTFKYQQYLSWPGTQRLVSRRAAVDGLSSRQGQVRLSRQGGVPGPGGSQMGTPRRGVQLQIQKD